MMFKHYFCLLGLFAVINTAHADESLFARLGGQPAIEQITSDLIDRSAADPVTGRTFQGKVNIKRLKKLLAEQFCEITGGDCHYSGDSMKQVHAGLGISEAEFYGMVEHLREVLDARGVAIADKNALLAKLAPMQRDIVEPKHAKAP